MIEYWATLGRCCVDPGFLAAGIAKAVRTPAGDPEEDHARLGGLFDFLCAKSRLSLSRWELADANRLLVRADRLRRERGKDSPVDRLSLTWQNQAHVGGSIPMWAVIGVAAMDRGVRTRYQRATVEDGTAGLAAELSQPPHFEVGGAELAALSGFFAAEDTLDALAEVHAYLWIIPDARRRILAEGYAVELPQRTACAAGFSLEIPDGIGHYCHEDPGVREMRRLAQRLLRQRGMRLVPALAPVEELELERATAA
ncbi:MAG TPA: hypothetical protein VF017_16355 [Thermoanaerobaculia bacterium]|nr:hypothetical protein [Thermoanaerobaculia bacterium]